MSEVHTDGRSYTPNKNNVPRKKINLPLEYISTDISPPNNNVFVVPDGEKKFIERDYKNCKLSYPRDKNDPGKIIIINYEFADKEPRIGSRRDVNEMILCLQRQGYNIYENDILTDKSKEYVLDYLEEGNVSFRQHTGSWMIQELCKHLFAYGRRDDVASILIRTTKCVCGNYFSLKNKEYRKQMPLMISTLKRKFYLNSNKDRHLLVQTYDEQVKVLEELEKIKKKLNKLEAKKVD